jgi:hypothetical protein
MGMMAWETSRLAAAAWKINEVALGAYGFPMTPFKVVSAFGAWLAFAEFVRQLIRVIVGVDPSGVNGRA